MATTTVGQSRAQKSYPWLHGYPEDVQWDAPIPAAPLYEVLDQAVEKWPENPCIDFLGKIYTYREIADLVARAAKGLQEMGVKKGVNVGLFLPNCPYFVIFYFAALKAGATVVNFNPLYAEREIAHQIEDSETDIMVTLDLKVLYDRMASLLDSTRLGKLIVCPMADSLPFPKNLLFPLVKRKEIARIRYDGRHARYGDVIANDGRYAPVEIDPVEDIAVLLYTGGTTGVPKGAMLTHANLYGNVRQVDLWFTSREMGGESVLAVLPLFHSFGMTAIMNVGLWGGAKLILLPRFNLDEVMQTIHKKRPTHFAGVPTMYIAINGHKDRAKYDFSSLKFANSGGASMPLEVMRTFEKSSGSALREGYGLSETSPVVCSQPFEGAVKEGSVGIPYPGTVVEIVSLDNPKKVLKQGEKGEITVSGPQVMKGYWKKPEETAKVMVGGRFLTGDIGYLDEDGWLFIVDRKKEMIIAGGYNIYPRNVEEAIYEHPAVEEAAVVGVPDAYRGETVKAFVTLKSGATLGADDLTAFLKDKLSPIEIPKLVEFRDELPKTAIGKIQKKVLLEEEEKKRAEADAG